MQVIMKDGLKIYIGVNGDDQMASCMNGTQTVYYGAAFQGSEGLSVSIAATPKIPKELLDEGNIDKIVDYLVDLFKPISSVCEVEIFLGPNNDLSDIDGDA
jgi:hypothetical protein